MYRNLKAKELGEFLNRPYLSSSQEDNYCFWFQGFNNNFDYPSDNGYQGPDWFKDWIGRVRCVRAF
jgi:hypothetical protein